MVRRTKEEAAATRERLLDTAEQLFLERGVARTTLQQIAVAAGLTRGAIYWHFKDKSDLFIAMMDRVVLPCEAVFRTEELQRAPAPLAMLRAALRYPLERLRDDAHTRRAFTIAIHHTEYNEELATARERYLRSHAQFGAAVEALLRAAQARGDIDAAHAPGSTALGLLALVDGSLRLATLHADGAPAIEAGLRAIDIHLHGLHGRPAAHPAQPPATQPLA